LVSGGTRERLEELVRAAKRFSSGDPPEPAGPAGFRTVQEYLTEAKARSSKKTYWTGVLREGEVSMLAGRAMAGKSTFACALTRCLTFGNSLLGRQCMKAKVGYMALERNGLAVAQLLEKWNLDEVCRGVLSRPTSF
jgi:hypothetical protein